MEDDTGTPSGDSGAGSVDCGSIPGLHANTPGDIYCGYGTDGGDIDCLTGNMCCLGGSIGGGMYAPQVCNPWNAAGVGLQQPRRRRHRHRLRPGLRLHREQRRGRGLLLSAGRVRGHGPRLRLPEGQGRHGDRLRDGGHLRHWRDPGLLVAGRLPQRHDLHGGQVEDLPDRLLPLI